VGQTRLNGAIGKERLMTEGEHKKNRVDSEVQLVAGRLGKKKKGDLTNPRMRGGSQERASRPENQPGGGKTTGGRRHGKRKERKNNFATSGEGRLHGLCRQGGRDALKNGGGEGASVRRGITRHLLKHWTG